MASYIGAIDQGTTSSRFIIFDRSGRIVSTAQKEHEQIYPQPGWVEHDPEEIWRRTHSVIHEAMEARGLRPQDLAAIGITNQRETTVVWHKKSGKPIYNAIVWQDTRVASAVAEFTAQGGQNRYRAKTGLPLATYFSGLKIRWILRPCRRRPRTGRSRRSALRQCRFFPDLASHRRNRRRRPCDRCDQRQPHPVDEPPHPSVGSEILRDFGIPIEMMPKIVSSSEVYGVANCRRLRALPSPAISEISKPLWSARPASNRAKRRTPTAPAASC